MCHIASLVPEFAQVQPSAKIVSATILDDGQGVVPDRHSSRASFVFIQDAVDG